MKITHLIALAAISLPLYSCDEVDADNRFIEVPPVEAQRVVLLEEFTGQKCINCPNAHHTIELLTEQYAENFIPVSIHAGGDQNSYGEDQYKGLVGLRIPEGEQYADALGILSYPTGVINRRTGLQTRDQWSTTIYNEVKRPALLDLSLDAQLVDGQIEITTDVAPHINLAGNLQLWVVESGIVARQVLPSGKYDNAYIHNNVFRGSVNGHDGEPVTLVTREPQQFKHSIALKDNWDASNLSIVAFVYTPDGGVEQAAITSVKIN